MIDFGERLKELRKSKQQTLKQVAEVTGLSISFLSQIEHSKCSLTIETLMKISEALDVNPSYFFTGNAEKEEEKKIAISKRNDVENNSIVSNFTYENLAGHFSNQTFLPTLVTLQPRKEGVRPLPHKGQEFIFVLSGALTIIFDDKEVSLECGESIHMESSIPHNWINKKDEPVKFLYVSSH